MERNRLGRLVLAVVAVLVASCGGGGGGGGGSKGIGLVDLNMDGQIVVLCFGDSITRGVGDGPSEGSLPPAPSAGYPARLLPLLIPKSKLPVVVLNDGVPGERTPSGLPRLRQHLATNPVDYAIILEGTNDVEDGNAPRALDNIKAMIDATFGAGAQPVIGTITPSCCAHKNQLPFGAGVFYNNQLRGIAAADMVPVIDFYNAFTNGPGMSGEDLPYDQTLGLIHVPEGLHPTPAGYDLMAATAAAIF